MYVILNVMYACCMSDETMQKVICMIVKVQLRVQMCTCLLELWAVH